MMKNLNIISRTTTITTAAALVLLLISHIGTSSALGFGVVLPQTKSQCRSTNTDVMMRLGAAASDSSSSSSSSSSEDAAGDAADAAATTKLTQAKAELLGLLGRQPSQKDGVLDPVLADPATKEPIRIASMGTLFGDPTTSNSQQRQPQRQQSLLIRSPTNEFEGSSDTFLNLLEPKKKKQETTTSSSSSSSDSNSVFTLAVRQLTPLIPPQLRSLVAERAAGSLDQDDLVDGDGGYIPMRDLFTSPAVSYAYERGWRQGFAQAGFPGPDREFEMAKEYFAPAVVPDGGSSSTSTTSSRAVVVVDMSCATGLFTRRFAKEDKFDRVIGCDYSESMLTEARRRISSESALSNLRNTRLDLVRLDVGNIPMQDGAVDALHAGAAMHCWPDLEAAMQEIYRVLKPGGRYFATTFLAQYFSVLRRTDGGGGGASSPSQQAFQYFTSVDELRKLVVAGGFDSEKVKIEVLGAACVVIRAEK